MTPVFLGLRLLFTICVAFKRVHCLRFVRRLHLPPGSSGCLQVVWQPCAHLQASLEDSLEYSLLAHQPRIGRERGAFVLEFLMPFTLIKVQFDGHLFTEVGELLCTEKTRTTPYHPQSHGLVERMNPTLVMMLSIRAQEDKRWDEFLPEVVMACRVGVKNITKFTPFHLMFGREIRLRGRPGLASLPCSIPRCRSPKLHWP